MKAAVNKKQARLNFALTLQLRTVTDVSAIIYNKVLAKVKEKQKEKSLSPKEKLEELAYRSLVEETFKENFDYIETQGKLMVQNSVRRFGVHYSLTAWIMLKEYVEKKRKGTLSGIPIILEPFDHRFRVYPEYRRLTEKGDLILPETVYKETRASVKAEKAEEAKKKFN